MYEAQNYDDLPDAIVSQLNKSSTKGKLTTSSLNYLKIIADCGGSVNADQVIIGLYKKHNLCKTRSSVIGRLHYLRKQGLLEPKDVIGIFTISEKGKKLLPNTKTSALTASAEPEPSEGPAAPKSQSGGKPKSSSSEPANANMPRTITCSYCETVKTFPAGKIVFRFEGEDFCTPDCIKDYRESKL